MPDGFKAGGAALADVIGDTTEYLGSYTSPTAVYWINSDGYHGVATGIPGKNISKYRYIIVLDAAILKGSGGGNTGDFFAWRLNVTTKVGGHYYDSSRGWSERRAWTYNLIQTGNTFTFQALDSGGSVSALFQANVPTLIFGVI